jgi:hypothetical protein
MGYVMLGTSNCANECIICCVEKAPGFDIAHIGKTERQKKGIRNLMMSMQSD